MNKTKDFKVLILGSDFNTYYMARCYHELYNEKVDVISKSELGVVSYSTIVNFRQVDNFEESNVFVKTLNDYAKTIESSKILIIGTSDELVRLIVENKDKLNKKYVHNYPSLEILNKVLVKDTFYEEFQNCEFDIPRTYIYNCEKDNEVNEEKISKLQFPLVVKPGNNIEYHKCHFDGKYKVFKAKSKEELLEIVKKIKVAGYKSKIVIQEFIPGDDCALFDSVFYCGKDKKVKLMTFAQIGLQERNPGGIGNCTLLVNGFNEHGFNDKVVNNLKKFMERIGYQGFAEFDLKYDYRDKKYKVLEINPRQARSSYYLAAAGHNLVKQLIDDVIYNKAKDRPCTFIKDEVAVGFVPKSVVKKYVTSEPLKEEALKLFNEKKVVNPLKYGKDKSLKRRMYLVLKDVNYLKKYKKYTW